MVKFRVMKNLFGFIFYFLIMFLVVPIPCIVWYLAFSIFFCDGTSCDKIANFIYLTIANVPCTGYFCVLYIAALFFILVLILSLYFILPVRITKKAIKNNWSSYLNFFFNNVFLLTLVLIILFIATIFPIIFGFSDEFIKVGDFIISQTLLFFILPVYFLIYLTSLIEKIKKNWLSRL